MKSNVGNNLAVCAALLGCLAAAQAQPVTSHAMSPGARKVYEHLLNASSVQAGDVKRDVAALARHGLKYQAADLEKFVAGLLGGLKGVKLSPRNAADLARDLEVVLNQRSVTPRMLRGCTRDFRHMLKIGGMKYELADAVGEDLLRIVPDAGGPLPPDTPAHRYMFSVQDAPKYDKSIMVEDFERGGEFFKIWYTPKDWSHGLVGVIDPANKSGGKFGATIYNDVPPLQLSGTATVPRPFIDFKGMNALRMWIKPYGNDPTKCELQTGIIDGSEEIWQIDLPEALPAKEPFILQIRLADFRRALRPNNRIIDPECQNFGFWILGSFKFSVDDVMFVHDPSIPDYRPGPAR